LQEIASLYSLEENMSENSGSSLYQKHIPIVTRSVKGNFRTFKTAVMLLAYSVYFLLPWLPWQRVSACFTSDSF
jgi:hypothetical protein